MNALRIVIPVPHASKHPRVITINGHDDDDDEEEEEMGEEFGEEDDSEEMGEEDGSDDGQNALKRGSKPPEDPADGREKRPKKKKKPRDTHTVAIEALPIKRKKYAAAKRRAHEETTRKFKDDWKDVIINPALDYVNKTIRAFRDRISRKSFIATTQELDDITSVEKESLVVFSIVLERGQNTVRQNTLMTLTIEGSVHGYNPDPMYMNVLDGGTLSDQDPPESVAAEQLDFTLLINGNSFHDKEAMYEILYFSDTRKVTKPHVNGVSGKEQFCSALEEAEHSSSMYSVVSNSFVATLGSCLMEYYDFLSATIDEEDISYIDSSMLCAWLKTCLFC